jgi:hypothetical protein
VVESVRYHLDAAPHSLADFLAGAQRGGLHVTGVREVTVDDDLVRSTPTTERLRGRKLLFVLEARRPPP